MALLAPLVVNRKGFYTDLAKWARGKGVSHLRVDGEWLPTERWPRLDRFREHTIELPVAELKVDAGERGRACATRSRRRRTRARAWCTLLAGGWGAAEVAGVLDQARLPFVRRAASRSSTRASSPTTRKHGWCPACYGTGVKLEGVDWNDERAKTGTEDHVLDSWVEWLRARGGLPGVRGQAPEPRGAGRALPRPVDRRR